MEISSSILLERLLLCSIKLVRVNFDLFESHIGVRCRRGALKLRRHWKCFTQFPVCIRECDPSKSFSAFLWNRLIACSVGSNPSDHHHWIFSFRSQCDTREMARFRYHTWYLLLQFWINVHHAWLVWLVNTFCTCSYVAWRVWNKISGEIGWCRYRLVCNVFRFAWNARRKIAFVLAQRVQCGIHDEYYCIASTSTLLATSMLFSINSQTMRIHIVHTNEWMHVSPVTRIRRTSIKPVFGFNPLTKVTKPYVRTYRRWPKWKVLASASVRIRRLIE